MAVDVSRLLHGIESYPKSMRLTISFHRYTGSGVVASVAYDLFSNADCGTTPEFAPPNLRS